MAVTSSIASLSETKALVTANPPKKAAPIVCPDNP